MPTHTHTLIFRVVFSCYFILQHSCIFLCRFLSIPARFLLVPNVFSCHLSIKNHSTGYTNVCKDSLGLNKGACQQTLAKKGLYVQAMSP